MTPRQTLIAHVPVSFRIDPHAPPPAWAIHDALAAVRAIEFEVPTLEIAELYAQLLIDALEHAGSAPSPAAHPPGAETTIDRGGKPGTRSLRPHRSPPGRH